MKRDSPPKKTKQKQALNEEKSLPSKQDIVTFLKDNPDLASKRDIAKAFNLKGDKRIWLKDMLRLLKDEGLISKNRKRVVVKNTLPPVSVLEIVKRDQDGAFIASPVDFKGTEQLFVIIHPNHHIRGSGIGVGERILAKIFKNKDSEGPQYSGRLIKKLDRTNHFEIGILRKTDTGHYRLQPIHRKASEIAIDDITHKEALPGDLVEVIIDRDHRYGLKQGRIHSVLGRIESEKSLSMIAIISHDIPHIFPKEVIDEVQTIQSVTLEGREDWRALDLITIDPSDAKDHDDAVHAVVDDDPNNLGGFILTIAIADVSTYVHSSTLLDKEAYKRGNSVYFPERVVPMLPERISNDLCSLREGEDRPALAVRIIIDANGRKRKHSFHRIMMRSSAKLSYQQAQAAIDGKGDEKTQPLLEKVLKPLWAAYFSLNQERNKRQPLELDIPEKKVLLDDEGRVKDVIVPPRLDAHKLIEEFMIQANVAAAEVLKKHNQPLIYRVHDQPSLAKQEALRDFLHSLGITLARGVDLTPARLNTILEKVADSSQQELVNQVVLRSQSQAEYTPHNIGHFGLHLHNYAHFTSPIRRYADLTVHRGLIKALKLGKDGIKDDQENELEDIARTISLKERRAIAAERDTVDRLIAHFLADKIGATFSGRISGVTKSGLFIALDRLGADGFIPISTLDSDYYHFDESRHALNGERGKKGYQLGDQVEIRLVEAQPIAGALRFEMLSPPRALSFSPVSYHKTKRHKGIKNRKNHKGRRR
ncbi:ribonuclease R [Bartonella tamiae]|uniref:Ribonuclease R n=1 Tax=Bartonella tamiae Th239 TaxID=1094558 RepID=J0QSA6_9HYPH|nr:ribonuclease R [Bartonella tamiae]EJF88751.1 ribonuclease R [Bartonella tamiae Th239]EJF94999.1 ribonuclease R [Bartonella tamiae Th307]